MTKNKYVFAVTMLALALGLLTVAPVFAQTNVSSPAKNPTPSYHWLGEGKGGAGMMDNGAADKLKIKPVIFGTVSAVSGNLITVSGRTGVFAGPNQAPTTYTIDATGATVMKNNAASTVANIAVGDVIAVQGTLKGANVTATMIRDGQMMGGSRPAGMGTVKSAPAAPALTVGNNNNVSRRGGIGQFFSKLFGF